MTNKDNDWLAISGLGPAGPPRPGTVLGRFELLRETGRSLIGVLYEAQDRELHRKVAIRVLSAPPTAVLTLRAFEGMARLTHPGIAQVLDAGRHESHIYVVSELLQGQTLAQRLATGAISIAEALDLAAQIAHALAHAHVHGVVHRGLAPSNIFLCDMGQVKLTEFGMARALRWPRTPGETSYMAPEQWWGEPEDERTDVFALGIILFEMLSGERPFPGDGGSTKPAPTLEIAALGWWARLLAASSARGNAARRLSNLVAQMLAIRPTERLRDAAEVGWSLATLAGLLPKRARVVVFGSPAESQTTSLRDSACRHDVER